jgi:adenosylcobinamide kinase/adenosylcobinamide-phosphate guanylyltransferase
MGILITGGARSGKSRFAESLAASVGSTGIYIATAEALDDEMRERIGRHRLRRETGAFNWRTIEAPFELTGALAGCLAALGPASGDRADPRSRERSTGTGPGPVLVIDCLTVWLSNWLLRLEREPDADAIVQAKVDELAAAFVELSAAGIPVIAVTNEVGDGIVPAYPLGRRFRDLAGWMNQRLAAICGEVFLVTAGIPVALKQLAYRLPESGKRADV